MEIPFRRLLVAVQLSGLGRQQHGQRRVAQHGVGFTGEAAGTGGVTGRDRDHAAGQRPIATLTLAGAAGTAEGAGSAPDAAPQPVGQSRDGDQNHHHQQEHGERRVDDEAQPVDGDGAGMFDEVDGERYDDRQLDKKPDGACHYWVPPGEPARRAMA